MIPFWMFASLAFIAMAVHIKLETSKQSSSYLWIVVFVHMASYVGLVILAHEHSTSLLLVLYSFCAPYLAQVVIRLLYRDEVDEWRQARTVSEGVDQEIAAIRSKRQPSRNMTHS